MKNEINSGCKKVLKEQQQKKNSLPNNIKSNFLGGWKNIYL